MRASRKNAANLMRQLSNCYRWWRRSLWWLAGERELRDGNSVSYDLDWNSFVIPMLQRTRLFLRDRSSWLIRCILQGCFVFVEPNIRLHVERCWKLFQSPGGLRVRTYFFPIFFSKTVAKYSQDIALFLAAHVWIKAYLKFESLYWYFRYDFVWRIVQNY